MEKLGQRSAGSLCKRTQQPGRLFRIRHTASTRVKLHYITGKNNFPCMEKSWQCTQGSCARGFSCLESVQDKAHCQHLSKITLHQGKNSSSLNGKRAGFMSRSGRCSGSGTPTAPELDFYTLADSLLQ